MSNGKNKLSKNDLKVKDELPVRAAKPPVSHRLGVG